MALAGALLGAAGLALAAALPALERRRRFSASNTRAVLSCSHGRCARFRAHAAHDSAAAAAVLAELDWRVGEFLRFLLARERAFSRAPARRAALERIRARYRRESLVENSPLDPAGDTAYTVDKGQTLALCLRDRAPPHALEDTNGLTFVLLHELAHLAVDFRDHPSRFWAVFRWLLAEAAEAGIYYPEDYARRPWAYCGVDVNYSPLFDDTVPEF